MLINARQAAKIAPLLCVHAQCSMAETGYLDTSHRHLEGLMTFLAVARLGRYNAAGEALGVNHSTVSRRIHALEKAMGGRVLVRATSGWEVTPLGRQALSTAEEVERALSSLAQQHSGAEITGMVRLAAPDAFSTLVAAPALAGLQNDNQGLAVELISATQRVRQNRSGVDLEVVAGEPSVHKAVAAHIVDYSLGLYASEAYLAAHGVPRSLAEIAGHRINFYIESALHVDDLDRATESLPDFRHGIDSTSVFAHVAATEAGAGIGILSTFLADQNRGLRRILRDEYSHPLSYWAVVRQEATRNPAVALVIETLRSTASRRL